MDDDTFLALFSYERRIPLEECATSPFDRNGESTSGKHARDLIERILTTDPFRERRYKFALAHEPDPAAQQAVNNHYNAFAEKDPNLRKVSATATLYGTLSKTHLWAGLWGLKGGIYQCSEHHGSQATLQPDASQPALMDALDHGLWYRVIKHEGVQRYKHIVVRLMERDNDERCVFQSGR